MREELPDHRVVFDEYDARWVLFGHGAILPQRRGSMLGKTAKGTGKFSRSFFAGSRAFSRPPVARWRTMNVGQLGRCHSTKG
jgi:hypothetical protein